MTTRSGSPSVQDFPSIYPVQEQLRFLLRYAVLAPSTRNTQPWRFTVNSNTVEVRADLGRAHAVADDDHRELFLSLGCAIENLVVAAEYFGFRCSIAYLPPGREQVAAVITLLPGVQRSPGRGGIKLQALLDRCAWHGRFTDRPLRTGDMLALGRCVTEDDLELVFITDPDVRGEIQSLHLSAHQTSLADPAFRHELAEWVGAGGLGMSWPVARVGQAALDSLAIARRLAALDAAAVGSAPVLGLISSRTDDRAAQLRSGQLLERVWLTATTLGLGLQPLSAALEVPSLRAELSRTFEEGLPWAQQLVRIGHVRGDRMPRTPRRSLDDLLDPPGAV